ncbi:MAG: hypothetical protein OMOMHJEC_02695 [Xanthomonadales bacterium]|nr:hypothetical protein [Xanthomonadales bacterium]
MVVDQEQLVSRWPHCARRLSGLGKAPPRGERAGIGYALERRSLGGTLRHAGRIGAAAFDVREGRRRAGAGGHQLRSGTQVA